MKIIYSYNKNPTEAIYWEKEIRGASGPDAEFIPFNHGRFLDPFEYRRAQLLDDLYDRNDPRLLRMYAALQETIREQQADVLLADNCFPYHPEFLRPLKIFKVQRTTDGSLAAYDRDFAHLHAYDYVLYYGPGYSRHIDMKEKLSYCRAYEADLLPLGSFDALCDRSKTADTILQHERDIDVIFIGSLHVLKMAFLARIKKRFGAKFVLRGLSSVKRNVYFNARHGFPGWITPIEVSEYAPLYQRAKIGINFHIRDEYAVGNYRLFDLPANGVMQISDGGELLDRLFRVGEEVVPYGKDDDICQIIEHYLNNDEERRRVALGGFERVNREYRVDTLLRKAAVLIAGQLAKSRNKSRTQLS
jgi:spore maturation protein CgeB